MALKRGRRPVHHGLRCPNCRSTRMVRAGFQTRKQRWLCRSCGAKTEYPWKAKKQDEAANE